MRTNWIVENSGLMSTYIEAIITLVSFGVALLPIATQNSELEVLWADYDKHIQLGGNRYEQSLRKFITPIKLYILSSASVAIIAGYFIQPPKWLCNTNGEGWWCSIRAVLQINADVIVSSLFMLNISLIGIFMFFSIHRRGKITLLKAVEKGCIQQANKGNGEIPPNLVKLISEIASLCSLSEDKQSCITTVKYITEECQELKSSVLLQLTESVLEIVESGDADNYKNALITVQTVMKRNEDQDDTEREKEHRAFLWKNFSKLIINVIRSDVSFSLQRYLDDFQIRERSQDETAQNTVAEPFRNVVARHLAEIGVVAVEEGEMQVAYLTFDKLHGEALKVVESKSQHVNEETIHQFFGLFAHLWLHDKAFKLVLKPFTDSFMDVVYSSGQSPESITTFLKNAEEFFAFYPERVSTISKLGNVSHEINQRDFVEAHLQTINADELADHYEQIVYHYPSINSLQSASLSDVRACGVPEDLAKKVVKSNKKKETSLTNKRARYFVSGSPYTRKRTPP